MNEFVALDFARAACQAAFAYIEGLGRVQNLQEARRLLSIGISKGLPLTPVTMTPLRDLLRGISFQIGPEKSPNLGAWDISTTVRNSFRELAIEKQNEQYPVEMPMERTRPADSVERQAPYILGERRHKMLQLAFKSGSYDLVVQLIECGSSPWYLDVKNCGPFHWPFMFPDDKFFELTSVLMSCEDREMRGRTLIDIAATTDEYIDPQIPFHLAGTPLAFATATQCKNAIRLLLDLGADPLRGCTPANKVTRDEDHELSELTMENSALHIACKYHFFRETKRFFFETLAWTFPRLRRRRLAEMLQFCMGAFYSASRSERLLYHGPNMMGTAKDVSLFLLRLHLSVHPAGWCLYDMLAPGVSSGNLELGLAVLELIEIIQKERPQVKTSLQEYREFILVCTEKACSGTLHPEVAISILQFALRAGADLDCKNCGERTERPINIAIRQNNKLVFDWFVSHGADLNAQDHGGSSPLHHMISYDFTSIYDNTDAINHGASTKLRDDRNMDALHIAIKEQKVEDVRKLMKCEKELGLDARFPELLRAALDLLTPNTDLISNIIDESERDGTVNVNALWYAMKQACMSGWTEIIRIILAKGFSASVSPSGIDWPPILIATASGQESAVRLLLEAGADPNEKVLVGDQ